MRASPYDIVAYRPATITAVMSASRRRIYSVVALLVLRERHGRWTGRERLRPDEDVLPVGGVLSHVVIVVRLTRLCVELDRAAREDRVVPGRAPDSVADLLLVHRA